MNTAFSFRSEFAQIVPTIPFNSQDFQVVVISLPPGRARQYEERPMQRYFTQVLLNLSFQSM